GHGSGHPPPPPDRPLAARGPGRKPWHILGENGWRILTENLHPTAHPAESSGRERRPRTDAPHAEGRDDPAARPHAPRPAAPLSALPHGVQSRAAPRSARPATAGDRLAPLAAPVPAPAAAPRVPRPPLGAP